MENKVLDFLFDKLKSEKVFDENSIQILNTNNKFNVNLNKNTKVFINLAKINDIIRINKFHEKINKLLDSGSFYISCGETLEQRNLRKKK